MANPYKKAEEVKKKAPGSRQEHMVKEEAVVVSPVVEATDVEPPIKPEKENLLAGMLEQKPRGKSYGFYLDAEVVDALEKLAKQNKSSKSKVLNTLLRNLLLK